MNVLVLWPVLFAAGAQTLTIDSHLGTSVEDCFDRIRIGEQLPSIAIYRNVSELTARECENLCKQDKHCQSFDYGVGAKGNATCDLSNINEKDIRENKILQRHPDYDVYIRRIQCEQSPPTPIQSQFDDPGPTPNHRPIFRPDDPDDRRPQRPQSDEIFERPTRPYNRPQPIYADQKPSYQYYNYYDVPYNRPYKRPSLKPDYHQVNNHIDYDRPDDYSNQRPEFDTHLGYGPHRPQDTTFKPEIPYKPINNPSNNKPKPDPYDVLHFQDQYNKPQRPHYDPGLWRPDPNYPASPVDDVQDIYGQKPQRPVEIPSKPQNQPQYNYFVRPTRRPGYQKPVSDSGYGQPPVNQDYRPDPYGGQNDLDSGPLGPPSYQRPIYLPRPGNQYYGQYASGYGQTSHYNQDNYIYLEINDPPRPYKPFKPDQGYTGSSGISSQNPYLQSNFESNQSNNYGQNYNKPIQNDYIPNKPSYSSNYGDNYRPGKPIYDTQSSYGGQIHSSQHYSQTYDVPQNTYGSQSYNKPQLDRPQLSYGSNRPQNDYEKPTYGIYNQPNEDHSTTQNSYGQYSTSTQSYGNKPSNDYNQGSYGSIPKPGYEPHNSYNEQNNYGNTGSKPGSYYQISHDDQSYGSKPSYGGDDYKNNQKPYDKVNTSNYGVKPVYEYELEKPSGSPSYIYKPGGQVISSKPVSISDYGDGRPNYGRDPGQEISYKLCFRRVLAGRRALRSHVRRVISCERLEDCRRECAIERRFHCESFNYRLDPSFRGKGLCEMMTKPIEAFDIRRDFVDDRDYDFYEVDRNSLEPNCPTSLRGPGYLHSGFLSSKPATDQGSPGYSDRWRDRYDDWRSSQRHYYPSTYDRYDNRRYHGRRRYEDQMYIPYQIGISRSNDDQESWAKYGGNYGGNNYYKDIEDYHNSVNHWLNDESYEKPDTFYGVKPYGQSESDFDYHSLGRNNDWNSYNYGQGWRRRWNSSGSDLNGLSYGESNYYGPRKEVVAYEERPESAGKDCSSRRKAGMSLGSGAIRRSLLARSVLDCEAACFTEREFKCVSYSYRYSNSHGSDNCFLSERPYRGLDLASDSGSDVYAMPQDHHCSLSHKPWVESECFWHLRSGAAVSGSSIKAALTVAGLGACEAECIRAHGFFCRGFSFRFDSPTIGDEIENCLLTSSPPTTLEPGHGLRPISGHELYARGNYGRGCEPALYDETAHREKQCYLKYDNAARLIGSAIRGQARVVDERACGAACTEAPFRCLSFSFNSNTPPHIDNCLLSEIRLIDLQRGVDYEHSSNDWLFAFDLFNGQCWRRAKPSGKDEHPTADIPRPIHPSGPSGPSYISPSGPYIPSAPDYNPRPDPPDFELSSGPSGYPSGPGPRPLDPRPDYSRPPSGPGYKPLDPIRPGYGPPSVPGYKPIDSIRPGYGPPSGPGYKPIDPIRPGYGPPSEPGYKPLDPVRPGYGPPPSGPGYKPIPPSSPGYGQPDEKEYNEIDGPINVSWRHYTVSGYPCRTGTACAQNVIAGHWSCEPEGGEVGSWDYCCAPEHRCGYSEGFHKPWCYVGSSVEQWRPCSEKYYPYHQHNIPHPSQGHRENHPSYLPIRQWSRPHERPNSPDSYLPVRDDIRKTGFSGSPYLPEADRRYWDDLYKNGPSAYYDRDGNPLPGYVRVPTSGRPQIKYHHNYGPRPGDGSHWQPVFGLDSEESLDPPVPGGLGVPRYWPVAYLHKEPPPNMTYFRYNETQTENNIKHFTTSTERHNDISSPISPPNERPLNDFNRKNQERPGTTNFIDNNNNKNNHRDEKTRNITAADKDIFKIEVDTNSSTTTQSTPSKTDKDAKKENITLVTTKEDNSKEDLKGISGKLDDFTGPIEVLDIEDAKPKGEKQSDLKTLEAEERQIEAIGRLLATRRGGKLVLEKRSQKDLETKSIAIDKELTDDFNFGNKFPATKVERRGIIQKVTKDEIEAEKNYNDKSLELSETTFVRPPRVLSTVAPNDNLRKAYVNGKVFYDATLREQRDSVTSTTRRPKAVNFLKNSEDSRINPLNQSYGRSKIKARNANPVRRVRRVYKKRYNPEEVRKRLLERMSMKDNLKNM